jgi:hypothetical protein
VAASVLDGLDSLVGTQIGARRVAELADALNKLIALGG